MPQGLGAQDESNRVKTEVEVAWVHDIKNTLGLNLGWPHGGSEMGEMTLLELMENMAQLYIASGLKQQ